MKAIILAAGKGTRLKKYTKNLPKGMLDFNGKTVIERQIELYRSVGIKDIIIVRGYKHEKIKFPNIKYFLNENYETTNMVSSLFCAKEEFNSDIIVSYSDILFEKKMLSELINNKENVSILVDDNWREYWVKRYGSDKFDVEELKINSQGFVKSIGTEVKNLNEIDSRYIGLLKFGKNAIKRIYNFYNYNIEHKHQFLLNGKIKSLTQFSMTDFLSVLITKGFEVYAIRYNNGWLEFDTDTDYEKALNWQKDGTINQFIRDLEN